MGYGMFAFASLGEDYFADGALAGIATAFVVAVVCVLLGDKTTTVYAARVTSTFFLGILIYGLVHSDEIDSTGGNTLLELKTTLAQQKKELLLAAAEQTMAKERLENFGVLASIGEANILPDVDRAIERAEEDMLRTQPQLYRAETPLAEVGLFAKFSTADLNAVEAYLTRASYLPGTVVFGEGDPGNEVLIVTKATASAYLERPSGNIRLATFAPGTIFGELAILDERERSATVIADEELVCFGLTTANFAALAAKSPDVAIRLLAAIGRELSGRLRTANRTIHQLET